MRAVAGARVLIMATDGFEESELFGPLDLLRASGASVRVAAPSRAPIQATVLDDPGRTIRPDLAIVDAREDEFDVLVLPGGVRNPDTLRTHAEAIALIRAFDAAAKPIGAICHGPWLLVEAEVLRGRKATSWPSIRTDVRNAGAEWKDAAAVVDGHLVTSRSPHDVPAFTQALIELIAARHA